jgi:hypothetical protein
MGPRERVLAALAGRIPDRVPRFEIWIDALERELGFGDPIDAYAGLGQYAIMMPISTRIGEHDGVDEFGRIWSGGFYRAGRSWPPAASLGAWISRGRRQNRACRSAGTR